MLNALEKFPNTGERNNSEWIVSQSLLILYFILRMCLSKLRGVALCLLSSSGMCVILIPQPQVVRSAGLDHNVQQKSGLQERGLKQNFKTEVEGEW